jgi:hypothetical protein
MGKSSVKFVDIETLRGKSRTHSLLYSAAKYNLDSLDIESSSNLLDFQNYTKDQLIRFRLFGKKTVDLLEDILKENGVTFKTKEVPNEKLLSLKRFKSAVITVYNENDEKDYHLNIDVDLALQLKPGDIIGAVFGIDEITIGYRWFHVEKGIIILDCHGDDRYEGTRNLQESTEDLLKIGFIEGTDYM